MAAKYNMAASSEYTMINFDISPAQTEIEDACHLISI